jgi:DinB superfamily
MVGRPQLDEAAAYYFTYIDQTVGDDPVALSERQLAESLAVLEAISEDHSLHRYAPGKWSMRQVLSHISDTERVTAFRAFWFARGFETALPSFEQQVAASAVDADRLSWATHVEEFRRVRLSTISLLRNMPVDAWRRGGIASDNYFTVRALAFIIAGHAAHHIRVLQERYL